MSFFRNAAVVAILACAALSDAEAADDNVATQDIDHSIKPGDDFYRYANGNWLKTVAIPAGQATFDTRAILKERTSQRVRSLIQEAASVQAAKGSNTQKVGDYYASFMDENGIETKGFTPLADETAAISGITNRHRLHPIWAPL